MHRYLDTVFDAPLLAGAACRLREPISTMIERALTDNGAAKDHFENPKLAAFNNWGNLELV